MSAAGNLVPAAAYKGFPGTTHPAFAGKVAPGNAPVILRISIQHETKVPRMFLIIDEESQPKSE